MKTHQSETIVFPKLERVDDSKTPFRYYTRDNINCVSVTSILSEPKKYENWIASIGQVEADKIKNIAMMKGTLLHAKLEDYFKNNGNILVEQVKDIPKKENGSFKLPPRNIKFDPMEQEINFLFNKLKPIIDETIDELYLTEQQMCGGVYDKFNYISKLAGTVDFVFKDKIVNKRWIGDLKTCSSQKSRDEIETYFCQTWIYSQMYEYWTKEKIDGVMIIMIDRNGDVVIHRSLLDEKEMYLEKGYEYFKSFISRNKTDCDNLGIVL